MPRVKKCELTEEQKNDIRKYAALQFAQHEVAVMMGIDPDKFQEMKDADELFWKARLAEQAVQRVAVLKEARNGDAQAQKLVIEWARISNQ
jgi:GH25 family lysozyme M1 (1,4-beta-N-acetylmuramidase)